MSVHELALHIQFVSKPYQVYLGIGYNFSILFPMMYAVSYSGKHHYAYPGKVLTLIYKIKDTCWPCTNACSA